jgi:hypothetical protein
MALSDLKASLESNTVIPDYLKTQITNAVLKSLKDNNSEVQNISMKWYWETLYHNSSLIPLFESVGNNNVTFIVTDLAAGLVHKEEETRDISSTGTYYY